MWRRVAKPAEGVQQLPDLSTQMRTAYQSFDFALALECHRVISLIEGTSPVTAD
jgi:hypothetical protein